MAWSSRRTPTPFHTSPWHGHFAAMAKEAELESANASGDRPFPDRCFSRAPPRAERNLILAFGGRLNQLRNPRNRGRIGRLKIELLDQEFDAVTPSFRIQSVW